MQIAWVIGIPNPEGYKNRYNCWHHAWFEEETLERLITYCKEIFTNDSWSVGEAETFSFVWKKYMCDVHTRYWVCILQKNKLDFYQILNILMK